MYNLQSGNVTNNKFIKILNDERNQNQRNELCKNSTLQEVMYLIFNTKLIDENIYNTISYILTLGDELSIPFNKSTADLLFFVTCTNSNNKTDVIIHNLTQAKTLYDLYDGDYTKIIELEDTEGKRFSMTTLSNVEHAIFYPGFNITWKIPVSFYRTKNEETGELEQKVTLSGIGYCEVIINEETFKVPRKIYINFFKNSLIRGRLIKNSTDEIKNEFDFSNNTTDILKEVFIYCGFNKKSNLSNIEIPRLPTYVENNKILCRDIENNIDINSNSEYSENSIYWKPVGGGTTKMLLPNLNYIALSSSNNGCFDLLSL